MLLILTVALRVIGSRLKLFSVRAKRMATPPGRLERRNLEIIFIEGIMQTVDSGALIHCSFTQVWALMDAQTCHGQTQIRRG